MKILRIFLLLAMVLMLCACYMKQAPTPYQRVSGLEGGYWDVHVADDVYMVKFTGNLDTERNIIKAHFARRAEEVCIQNGYRDFEFFSKPPDVLENVYWSKIRCIQ